MDNVEPVSDKEFIHLFETSESLASFALDLGVTERAVYKRRSRLEVKYGIKLKPKNSKYSRHIFPQYQHVKFKQVKPFDIVIVSDRHCEPTEKPPVFHIACEVIKKVKPKLLIVNGDWYDFANMSRHVQRSWENRPKTSDEIIAGTADLKHLRECAPKAKKYFTLGNHDMRFDGKLAELIPDLEGIKGGSLIDHIDQDWELTTSLDINDTLLVKHRFRAGVHAAWNNVLHTGVNVATGHTHRCAVKPFTDFNGTRYGIETGTMSDINSPVFAYCENNPKDWQPGFMVIHVEGRVIVPEPVRIIQQNDHPKNNQAYFQGQWYG